MKYIRTDDRIIPTEYLAKLETEDSRFKDKNIYRNKNGFLYKALKQADTIKELCDCFVVVFEDKHGIVYDDFEWAKTKANANLNAGIKVIVYGAIWTVKGLIYVAKMNDKGDLELI